VAITSLTFLGASKLKINMLFIYFVVCFIYMKYNLVDVEIRLVKVYSNQIDSLMIIIGSGQM